MKLCSLWMLALGAAALMAQDGEALLLERLERNPAWRRAQQTPAYDSHAPSGFVLDEAEKAQQRAAGEELKKQVAAAIAEGRKEFRMAPGQYRFADNSGWHFDHVQDFTLDGQGSTFWFERPMSKIADNPQSLLFTNCKGMTLKNFQIDFDLPVYIQGTILSIADNLSSLEMQIDSDWPKSDMGGGQFTLYTPEGKYIPQYTLIHDGATLHDGDKLTVKLNPSQLAPYFTKNARLEARRMTGKVKAGTLIALNFRRGFTIHVNGCENMTFENIDVWQSQGMGILENGGNGGNKFLNMRLIRKPGTRRIHYGTADHFHSNCVTHGALVENCEFAHTSDDNLNLHGNWRYCWKQLSPTTIVVGSPKPPVAGKEFNIYRIGKLEQVSFSKVVDVKPLKDETLLKEIADAKPQANERIAWRGKGQLYVVELGEAVDLPSEQLLVDTHVDNAEGFVIRGCYFHDSRSRGALLTGVGGGLLENNVWKGVHSGVSVYEESWGYAEGAIPQNVKIIGNTLIGCGGIETGLVPRDTAQGVWDDSIIRDVEIRDNWIVEGSFIHIMYVDGATVSGNVFWNPLRTERRTGDFSGTKNMFGHPQYLGMERHGAVFVTASKHVDVINNKVYLVTPGDLQAVQLGKYADGKTIRCERNEVIKMWP
ncbi:MAG: right-handed parallel beta-helix repeat-containing protein [Victivallales bacterium]|nr:right-handed parallel beta-helix repeat-containing protein [Victivallales bacterium]